MNVIWALLMLGAVACAAVNGSLDTLGPQMLDSAKSAAELALSFIGALAFWLGLLRIVEDGGGIVRFSRLMAPLLRKIFPTIPRDHPAMGAMLLNLSANMLGLANAATPFGLRAMESLDRLNGKKGTATNAMILFLALNTAGITALPVSTIVVRATAGSKAPASIIIPTLIATVLSATMAVLIALALQRLPSVKASEPPVLPDDAREEEQAIPKLNVPIALVGFGALFAAALWLVHKGDANKIGGGLLPLVAAAMLIFGISARVRVYESAVAGAKSGFEVAIRILPYLVIVLVAVGICRASGILGIVTGAIAHVTTPLGLPAEVVPQVIMRPLSASGTIAILSDTLKSNGADSFVGNLSSVLYGSSETTFYILSVYFGVISVQRMRHALLVCLLADAFGVITGTLVAHWFF